LRMQKLSVLRLNSQLRGAVRARLAAHQSVLALQVLEKALASGVPALHRYIFRVAPEHGASEQGS
jgi:hypothetical protein